MKLAFIDMCGFRGYSKPVRIDFSESFTIIDGRNGVGKSTIFDAVEFVLTGTISKYLDAKADRESVKNYLWWSGGGAMPKELYVRVGFVDSDNTFVVERTPANETATDLGELAAGLFDKEFAPKSALSQLCAASIIRDEHIARLSLDLKESDRFTLLRDAIGAVDAEDWIAKSAELVATVSARLRDATSEVEQANLTVTNSIRQVDQARSVIPPASIVSQAGERLQRSLQAAAAPDRLGDVARRGVAAIASRLDVVRSLMASLPEIDTLRKEIPVLTQAATDAERAREEAVAQVSERLALIAMVPASTVYSEEARQLENLVTLGRAVGLRNGHCPLCETSLSQSKFERGFEAALVAARELDAQAVDQAAKERALDQARRTLQEAEIACEKTRTRLIEGSRRISEYDARLQKEGLVGATEQDIAKRVEQLQSQRTSIVADLNLFDTISLDRVLVQATGDHVAARDRLGRAEGRLGRARLAEGRAKAIHDAVRRAAAETLDQRLERVLPLMSELYRRLRPHPVWDDIEYSVRGDVKRFLKLQVGGDVNPQFVFSSGQRRATGLAFLLSINLSIAWSRWRSILLDDPVQHVDDFRTVHLAEVLAHLCQSGRQIICAVEDSALADLMCRRLPSSELVPGRRITLANDQDGAIGVSRDETIAPLSRRCLVPPQQSMSA